MDAVKGIFRSTLYPIQYPAQGDFKWYFQNPNQVFNDATYGYVNALVGAGDNGTAALGAAGSFANAYVQVLNSMVFSLNHGDAEKLDLANKNAQAQLDTLVSDYQTTYGTITADQMTQAGVSTKQDYIVGYVLGSKWSGATPPLTWAQMSTARDLRALLPYAPVSANGVLADVTEYLNQIQPVLGFEDDLSTGAFILRSLKANTASPTAANGGMPTVDPNTGAILPVNVGWSIPTAIASITDDLQNTSNTIRLGMQTSQSSGSSISVHIDGQAGFDIGTWLEFSVSGGASYDMSKVSGTSTDCSVTIEYAGYSMVPMQPSAWQQATGLGFYYPDPIAQAVANQGKDVTGFKFLNAPPYKMGAFADGGNFGLLTNVLIANYPTITITYTHADFSSFKEAWSEHVDGNLTLFGFIKLGSFSQGAYGSKYEAGSDNSTFTVTFSGSPALVSVPQLMQQAYVIAGAMNNPGVTPQSAPR
jgi:hypothetical protein